MLELHSFFLNYRAAEENYNKDKSPPCPHATSFTDLPEGASVRLYYKESDVKLTVTKTVTGEMGDPTKEFEFTLSGLTGETSVTGKLFASASDTTGIEKTYQVTSGAITFTLKHGQKIELTVPTGKDLTLTETPVTGYKTWMVKGTTAINGSATTNTNLSLGQLTEDTTVQVLNRLDAVSPTGVTMTYAPYALMLLFGALILAISKRRGKERS